VLTWRDLKGLAAQPLTWYQGKGRAVAGLAATPPAASSLPHESFRRVPGHAASLALPGPCRRDMTHVPLTADGK